MRKGEGQIQQKLLNVPISDPGNQNMRSAKAHKGGGRRASL